MLPAATTTELKFSNRIVRRFSLLFRHVSKKFREIDGTSSPGIDLKSQHLINSGVVWPDVGIKSCPSFFKSCLKSSLTSLIKKSMVFTTAQNSPPYIWAAFVIKFVSKTFQKSPNLFTLFRCPELGKPSLLPKVWLYLPGVVNVYNIDTVLTSPKSKHISVTNPIKDLRL